MGNSAARHRAAQVQVHVRDALPRPQRLGDIAPERGVVLRVCFSWNMSAAFVFLGILVLRLFFFEHFVLFLLQHQRCNRGVTCAQVRNYHMGFMELPRSDLEGPQLVLL